jgi:hypothetical protein
MKKLFVLLVVGSAILLTALPAYAVMTMTSEFYADQGVPDPPWCLGEDDAHLRNFSGTLEPGESFVVTDRVCTTEETSGGSDGLGLFYKTAWYTSGSMKGSTVSLYVIFPDGSIRYAHSTESANGYSTLTGCVAPLMKENPDYRADGVVIAPIQGGTYQVVLTNTGSKAISPRYPVTEVVRANTLMIVAQKQQCPPEDWNIEPA